MAIIDSNVGIITVVGMQSAELTYSTMEYYPTTGLGEESAQDFVDGWVGHVVPNWLALVSANWSMIEVRCSKKVDGNYTEAKNIVGSPGLGDIQTLPVWNTFSLVKLPDNANREPIGERMVGKGRIAISGVGEDSQNNAVITAISLIAANLLGLTMRQFTSGGVPTEYTMFIQSLATLADPIEVFAPVSALPFNRIGTQLTRKR